MIGWIFDWMHMYQCSYNCQWINILNDIMQLIKLLIQLDVTTPTASSIDVNLTSSCTFMLYLTLATSHK